MILLIILFIILILIVVFKIVYKFFYYGKCTSYVCLAGKTAIITGGTSGLGFETSLELASRGCTIIIADCVDATEAVSKLISSTRNPNISAKHLDLASLQSVRKFAKEIQTEVTKVDFLINNAGVAVHNNLELTEDGLNRMMQINYFGHFLLTHLLLELLEKSAPSRIIWIASTLSFLNNLTVKNINPTATNFINTKIITKFLLYANSKLCMVIASEMFGEKLRGRGVTSNSCCPGLVKTSIFRKSLNESIVELVFFNLLEFLIIRPFGKTIKEGVQTPLHLALSSEIENESGGYYFECKKFFVPIKARSKEFRKKIWILSEKLTGISNED